MIRSLRLSNFRAFRDSTAFPIRNLTCLVGRNSSGKSSVAHALLLLRQSTEERAAGLRVPRLVLNGSSIEAGTYADIVYQHREELTLGFTFGLEPDRRGQKSSPRPRNVARLPIPRSSRALARQFFRYAPWRFGHFPQRPSTVSLGFSPHETFGPTLSFVEIEVEGLGSATFTRTVEGARREHWRVYTSSLPSRGLTFRVSPGNLLPLISRREETYSQVGPHQKRKINQFLSATEHSLFELTEFLNGLRFLGPFRTPPERRYVFGGFGAADTGATGKYAVDLLITEMLLNPRADRELAKQVSYWLDRLGLASSLEVRELAKRANLFEVRLNRAGHARHANFVDVGFGVSQVLPVLVQGLLTPPGGTYVVQQPELHLHPDAQAELADFFLELSTSGVRCLVETHSEYFLIRLRRLLAEDCKRRGSLPVQTPEQPERRSLSNEVAVVVAIENKANGHRMEQLTLNEDFQFENLPPDFMSQAVKERIALLRALD